MTKKLKWNGIRLEKPQNYSLKPTCIIKSGKTFVKHENGIDSICINPEKPDCNKIWIPISDIKDKIPNEILKLEPVIIPLILPYFPDMTGVRYKKIDRIATVELLKLLEQAELQED